MNRLYWTALTILVAIVLACGLYARRHPSQPWDFSPPALPVDPDELGKLNQP